MAKATPENILKDQIKQALSVTKTKPPRWAGLKLFSNPRGVAKGPGVLDRYISYGLAPGSKTLASSDFIGWHARTITPAMVGQTIAQFVSIEAKAPGKKATQEQEAWLTLVNQNGGLGFTARDITDIDVRFQLD